MPRTRSLLKLLLLAGLVAGAIYLAQYTELGRQYFPDSIQSLRARVSSYSPYDQWAYVFLYIVGTFFLVPGTLLSFVGATLFGTVLGTLLTWVGASVGATLIFLLVRLLARDSIRDFVNGLLGGRMRDLDRWIERHGFWSLLVVRLVPLFPFNGVNFGAGLTGIRTPSYLSATTIGILPGVFVYQYLFATIGERIFDADGWEWQELADPWLWLPIGLFALFVALGGLVARRLAAR